MFTTMRYARYAAYCACACIVWRMISRRCDKCMEKPDDWNIEEECGKDEAAAGYLRKKGKGADVWTKRYIVLVNGKLIYYVDQMRDKIKGEIVIAGASANASGSRPDEEKMFFFEITHPQCGTREFYAKSDNRRRQWVNKVNSYASELASVSHCGHLFKKGGFISEVFQRRWCSLNSHSLDYFDEPTSSNCKGSIDIRAAIVREASHEQYAHCFELEQRGNVKTSGAFGSSRSKKGKIYLFAADNVTDRDAWVNSLKASAGRYNEHSFGQDGEVVNNPIAGKDGNSADWMTSMGMGGMGNITGDGGRERRGPDVGKAGHLEKKSSTLLHVKNWHRRFFKLEKNKKSLLYWEEQDGREGTGKNGKGGAGGTKASGTGGDVPGQLVLTEGSAKPKNSAMAKLAAALDEDKDKEQDKGQEEDREAKKDDGDAAGEETTESALDNIPEKGGILIADIRGHLSREDTTGFYFTVRGGRVYHLRAETVEDREDWIDAIEAWIDYYQ